MNGLKMRSRKKSKDTLKQIKLRTKQPKNLWDTGKAILKGKFIAIQAYLKKQEKAQINNLILHLKEGEKRTTNKAQSE